MSSRYVSEQRRRRRERVALSLLSLLILFSLLGGYALLRATQEQEGKLSLLSTSQVTISVGGQEQAPEPQSSALPEATPTAAPGPASSNRGRGPSLTTEVLSADQTDASASSSAGAAANGGASSGQASAAVATPTRAPGGTTGVLPPGLSLGGTGPGGTGGNNSPPATSTAGAGGPVASPTPGSGATPVPTATPGTPATAVPTSAPPLPTQTPVPEDVSPPGHHSHLHMDGFVGPGAYKAGGIIVSNIGSVAFDYSVNLSVTGDQTFASLLRLRIYLRVGATCDYPGQPPTGASSLLPLTGDQAGTVLYDGTFTTGNKIGDPAAFPAAGDRHLAPGQSEVLCMEVFFPWTAGNEYQGLHVDGTQTFTAKSPDH